MVKYLVIVAILFLCGCDSSVSEPILAEESNSDVVLIFKDSPVHTSITFASGSKVHIPDAQNISYVDSAKRLIGYTPLGSGYDTVVIPTFEGVAEVSHYYKVYEQDYYLFKAGDTVLISYDNHTLRPEMHSLSSSENTKLYNLTYNFPDALLDGGYTLASLFLPWSRSAQAYTYRHGCRHSAGLDSLFNRHYIDLDSINVRYLTYMHA